MRRICGATGREIWTRRFPSIILPDQAGATGTPDATGRTIWKCKPPVHFSTRRSLLPRLIRPAPDLDGDGTGDLVWYSPEHLSDFIIAISGATGRLLWLAAEPNAKGSRISSRPLIADVNQDGLADIIVCVDQQKGPPWIEAIIGKDGTRLWRQYIDDLAVQPASTNRKTPPRFTPRHVELVNDHGRTLIAVEGESRICFHSMESGLPTFDALTPPGLRSQSTCFADFDGNGESEAILFRKHDLRELIAGFPPYTISAWPALGGRQLWRKQLSCALAAQARDDRMLPLTDVDNDRRKELAVSNYVRSSLSIDLVDAMTCQSRWPQHHRLSRNPEASLGQILQCPDVDGDSIDDLLVVTLDRVKRSQSRLAIFLDLLSGS